MIPLYTNKSLGIVLIIVIIVTSSIMAFKTTSPIDANKNSELSSSEPIAVIELFTSQGCSSCPRADQTLIELSKQSTYENLYLLSFHVSYWNYLGWKDPYSQEQFSTRQRNYSRALSSNVYTPQMVFNGKYECVGSVKEKVYRNTSQCLENTNNVSITIKQNPANSDNEINLDYKVLNLSDGNKILNIALAEKNVETKVGRGENGGRTLKHHNVVREFKSVRNVKNEGKISISIPKGLQSSNATIIGYVQEGTTLEILSACKLDPGF